MGVKCLAKRRLCFFINIVASDLGFNDPTYAGPILLVVFVEFPANGADVVKGGGKTYHCGGEKVYHRGNA